MMELSGEELGAESLQEEGEQVKGRGIGSALSNSSKKAIQSGVEWSRWLGTRSFWAQRY